MATSLVIEDGTDVDNANSFVTADDIIAYAKRMGVTIVNTDDSVDVLAFKAMTYILIQPCYTGDPAFIDSVLPFPRKGIRPGDCEPGYVYSIPYGVKMAQCQLALDVYNGIDLLPSIDASAEQIKAETIGPLKTEFFEKAAPGSFQLSYLPIAEGFLRPYLCGQGEFSLTTYRK